MRKRIYLTANKGKLAIYTKMKACFDKSMNNVLTILTLSSVAHLLEFTPSLTLSKLSITIANVA